MDYEKAYKEALERARKALSEIPLESYSARKIIKDAFPELAESEDERIRQELYAHIATVSEYYFSNEKRAEYLAWLKKQKKVDVTEFCQPIPEDIAKAIPDVVNECIYGEKQKEQKPAEWSEEDEKFLEHCSDILDGCGEPMCALRLKSLRPQHHWKPSEEQMKTLNYSIRSCCEWEQEECRNLESLYADLKKLM